MFNSCSWKVNFHPVPLAWKPEGIAALRSAAPFAASWQDVDCWTNFVLADSNMFGWRWLWSLNESSNLAVAVQEHVSAAPPSNPPSQGNQLLGVQIRTHMQQQNIWSHTRPVWTGMRGWAVWFLFGVMQAPAIGKLCKHVSVIFDSATSTWPQTGCLFHLKMTSKTTIEFRLAQLAPAGDIETTQWALSTLLPNDFQSRCMWEWDSHSLCQSNMFFISESCSSCTHCIWSYFSECCGVACKKNNFIFWMIADNSVGHNLTCVMSSLPGFWCHCCAMFKTLAMCTCAHAFVCAAKIPLIIIIFSQKSVMTH